MTPANGTPELLTPRGALAWVLERSIPVPESGCWLWVGNKLTDSGYARAQILGRGVAVHRWLYESLNGPVGDKEMDHLCRVRCCVNPAHLEPVTQRENTLRGVGHTAVNAAKTHCKRGHDLSLARIFRGKRNCRICKTTLQREQRALLRRRLPEGQK